MPNLTPEGLRVLTDVASRHGVGVDAALALLGALAEGNGSQAQFNHPDLGGMGQWSQGGMIMVGDMFNQGLKYRVDALCNELAGLLRSQPLYAAPRRPVPSRKARAAAGAASACSWRDPARAGQWWPSELGNPASTGAQNELRYAYFPNARRLAIHLGGEVRVYDTGEHRVSGFSQQQGGDQSLTFTSQYGLVRVADLPLVLPAGDRPQASPPPAAAAPPQPAPAAPRPRSSRQSRRAPAPPPRKY